MFSAEIIARLRAVLDGVCAGIPKCETDIWALVACKLLENAASGELTIEGLRAAGHRALTAAKSS